MKEIHFEKEWLSSRGKKKMGEGGNLYKKECYMVYYYTKIN